MFRKVAQYVTFILFFLLISVFVKHFAIFCCSKKLEEHFTNFDMN